MTGSSSIGESMARVYQRAPPSSLDDLRWNGTTVALFVTSHNCPSCRRFKEDTSRKTSFERNMSIHTVIPWDVSKSQKMKQLVADAGVTKIPCYVLLRGDRHSLPTVVLPSQ